MTRPINDERWMRVALREARRGLGQTSPNPAVGAVLVHHNKIISRAYHERPGGAHAEVRCLTNLPGSPPTGSTLYVTLEPCSTLGKTGRCTDAIMRAGISRVVVGTIDPNPQHNGRGLAALERAGIQVHLGVLADECVELNEGFNKWVVTRRPFVIAKCGMSLDGRLTQRARGARWLTSAASRRDAQNLRAQVDAILVGAETIRADDPRLTVRAARKTPQPWRVILTRSGNLPPRSRVFRDRFKARTVVYRNKSLKSVLLELGRKEVLSVLIEGGGELLGQALDEGLIDKVQIYLGPLLTGGPVVAFAGRGAVSTETAVRLERLFYAKLGHDLRVTGYPAAGAPAGRE